MALTPRQRAFLERRLGRALTAAELHIDVAGIDRALERAKDQLAQAIDREKRRAVRGMLRGQRLRLDVTGEMLAVLAALHREGRRQALREMRSMGAQPPHRFAVDPVEPRLAPSVQRLRDGLGRLTVRVEREAVAADIGGLAGEAVRRRLMRVAGARDAASRVVSGAFASGLAATFEDADTRGLFDGWQYTAVLDAGTCPECRTKDGRTYRTLAEAYVDLPDFGPNPRCFGDGRCRCRLVPAGPPPPAAGGAVPPSAPPPSPPAPPSGGGGMPPGPDPSLVAAVRRHQEAAWAQARRFHGITSAEYRRQVDELVVSLAARSELRKRIEPGDLLKAIRDGRLKSQFEAGTSGGYYGPAVRARLERDLFGHPLHLDPVLRPVYGYLDDGTMHRRHRVEHYGTVVLGIRASLRERSTLSLGDSLDNRPLVPQRVDSPTALAVGSEHYDPLGEIAVVDDVYPYLEAQIHGGVSLDDLEFVAIPEIDWLAYTGAERSEITDALAEHGVRLVIEG